MTVVENFSVSELDPMTYVKDVLKKVLYFILQVIITGLIISFAMKKSGLVDDQTMKTYMMYFVFGGISTYVLTFLYLWYKCKGKKDIDYKKLAKTSILGPSVIITHIILLFVCNLLKVVPEIGILIYLLSWTTFGIVGVSGILYTSALNIAERTSFC